MSSPSPRMGDGNQVASGDDARGGQRFTGTRLRVASSLVRWGCRWNASARCSAASYNGRSCANAHMSNALPCAWHFGSQPRNTCFFRLTLKLRLPLSFAWWNGHGPVRCAELPRNQFRISQVPQHLLQLDLLPEVGIVDRAARGAACLDRLLTARYVAVGCGDHFTLRVNFPFVARGRCWFRRRRCIGRCGRDCRARQRGRFAVRLIAGPNGEHLVQQFSHAVSQGHVAACAAGTQPSVQLTHGRIVRMALLAAFHK